MQPFLSESKFEQTITPLPQSHRVHDQHYSLSSSDYSRSSLQLNEEGFVNDGSDGSNDIDGDSTHFGRKKDLKSTFSKHFLPHGEVSLNLGPAESQHSKEALSSWSQDFLKQHHLSSSNRAESAQVQGERVATLNHIPNNASRPHNDRDGKLRGRGGRLIERLRKSLQEQTAIHAAQQEGTFLTPEETDRELSRGIGGYSYSWDSSHKPMNLFQDGKICRDKDMRTVHHEDYLTARAANPQTGVITPSVHSCSPTNTQINEPVAKWRRIGDEWVYMAFGQPTPDLSPVNSTDNLDGQVARRSERLLRVPLRMHPRNGVKTRDREGHRLWPFVDHPDGLAGKAYDKQQPQITTHVKKDNNLASQLESFNRNTTPHNFGSNPMPTSITRKAVGSSPSDLKARSSTTKYGSGDQCRSTSAPNQMPCTYFSPDDVGKDLPSQDVLPKPRSIAQSRENSCRQESFLGLSPGDFIEDIPVQFQDPWTSPQLGKPLAALPTSDGPFRSPVLTTRQQEVRRQPITPTHPEGRRRSASQQPGHLQSMPWLETSAMERTPRALKPHHVGGGIRTNLEHEYVFRPAEWRQSHSPPWKITAHHRHTCQTPNHLQVMNAENRPSGINGGALNGGRVNGNGCSSNEILMGQATSTMNPISTNTHTSTITTMRGQTENVCQVKDMPPDSAIQSKTRGRSMPALKRQDGNDDIPRVSSLADTDRNITALNVEKADACPSHAVPTGRNLNHTLTPQCAGADGGAVFGSGLTTVSPFPTTSRLITSEDLCTCKVQPTAKPCHTGGCIPMQDNQVAARRVAPSRTFVQERAQTSGDERRNRSAALDTACLQSPNSQPGHEHCCPVCCKQDFHDSCLGHPSGSSTTSSIPSILKPAGAPSQAREQYPGKEEAKRLEPISSAFPGKLNNLKASLANTVRLRRSFRTRTHETDHGSFTETETEELAELETPVQYNDHHNENTLLGAMTAESNAKHTQTDKYTPILRRHPSSTSSSASLHTLQFPPLFSFSIIEALLVPFNVAIMWCKSHPELLEITIVVLSRVTAMAVHVLKVSVEGYEVLAEYGRSGKMRCKRGDGWKIVREGGVAAFEAIVIVGVGIIVVRVAALGCAVVRVVWAVGRGVCWVLGSWV